MYQTEFKTSILENTHPLGISRDVKRFNVYKNNVLHSLIEGLGAKFPACKKLVGEEFFNAMADEYLKRNPPRSKIMALLGDDFPQFIAAFEHASSVPYLEDIALLEVAWLRVYHAQDATLLSASDFAAIAPENLPLLKFTLHPSLQLLSSNYPVYSIWHEIMGLEAQAPQFVMGEVLLIFRPYFEVLTQPLTQEDFGFLTRLKKGEVLGEALEGVDNPQQLLTLLLTLTTEIHHV